MADVTLTVDSRAVHQMLDRAPHRVNQGMRNGMEDSLTLLFALVRRYPPQRAGQIYVRTYALQRSWGRQIIGSGLEMRGVVSSSSSTVPYNLYVMSRADQASIHRGRWATVEDIAENSRGVIQRMFDRRLAEAIR
jgi:hypothetical protein